MGGPPPLTPGAYLDTARKARAFHGVHVADIDAEPHFYVDTPRLTGVSRVEANSAASRT